MLNSLVYFRQFTRIDIVSIGVSDIGTLKITMASIFDRKESALIEHAGVLRHRRSGIAVVKADNTVNFLASDQIRDGGKTATPSLTNSAGIRPFAAAKIYHTEEVAPNQLRVFVRHDIFKDGQRLWSVIVPLPFTTGVFSYPDRYCPIDTLEDLEGQWELRNSITIELNVPIPDRGYASYTAGLHYVALSRFAWEVAHEQLLITNTGEVHGEYSADPDAFVSIDDI